MATHKVTFLPLNVTVEVDDSKYPLADHGKPGSLLDLSYAYPTAAFMELSPSCCTLIAYSTLTAVRQRGRRHGWERVRL